VKPELFGPADAARATGVSPDTLRHYERVGLLAGVVRNRAGYRRYSRRHVERVLLIQRALVIGFSLDELRRVLAVRDRGGAPCGAVKNLVSDRLRALDERIRELHRLRDELQALVREWDARLAATPPGGRAHLLESLGSSSIIEATRRRRQDGVAKARRPRSTAT
jgi:MerR family transcriptional regulator, Zn(II)-responsive regulator of zntA